MDDLTKCVYWYLGDIIINNVSRTFSEDSVTVLLSKTEIRYPVIVPCSNYEYKIDSRCAGFGTECSEKCLEYENVPSACCPCCQLFSTLYGCLWNRQVLSNATPGLKQRKNSLICPKKEKQKNKISFVFWRFLLNQFKVFERDQDGRWAETCYWCIG